MPPDPDILTYIARPRIRLDRWLASEIPERSRTEIQRWLKAGQIRVNGQTVTTSYKLCTGDEVALIRTDVEEALPESLQPEAIPLDILYEDSDILVINKAVGMLVHPGAGRNCGTVANALLHHFPEIAAIGDDPTRPGIVHRLDADTSGILVVAKTQGALADLQRQFKDRSTRKEYRALIRGTPRFHNMSCTGPIGRSPHNRKKMAVLEEGGRQAVSHVTLLTSFAGRQASELSVRIETGRTHQIRVHLHQEGHPVLGDKLYGGRQSQLPFPDCQAPRQMLHAFRLRFQHPTGKHLVEFEAPLPSDYQTLVETLHQH